MPAKPVVVAVVLAASVYSLPGAVGAPQEAPSGFDGLSNGYVSQAEFDASRVRFEESETIGDGLGPTYNASSCAACHANPVIGGASQVTELRVGQLDAAGLFVPPPGGSLVRERAISPQVQSHISDQDTIRALRISPGVLGLGYIEAIDDTTLIELAARQQVETGGRIAGHALEVPVLEAPGVTRVARFGWKNQHASLLSFVADAYVNEMGITNRLVSIEADLRASPYDVVPDPEDSPQSPAGQQDIDALTTFIRATKVPEPDRSLAATGHARAGAQLFRAIGCATCHVETLRTAPVGTPINGGTFIVPAALGDRVIHPFSDFLLHDVGTGDGVPQAAASGAQFRTAPLWGLRTRTRFMHDGQSLTLLAAVRRHGREAADTVRAVRRLNDRALKQLLAFLQAL